VRHRGRGSVRSLPQVVAQCASQLEHAARYTSRCAGGSRGHAPAAAP
jgi:hypothetical protein